jgi:hypothetical protein
MNMATTRKTAAAAERATAQARIDKPAANTVIRSKAPTIATALAAEQKRRLIEVAAYYIAERRGFAGGDAATDWLAAEAEIDTLMAKELISA